MRVSIRFSMIFLTLSSMMELQSCYLHDYDDNIIGDSTVANAEAYKLLSEGVSNTIKKARQMTDITFIPHNPIDYNVGTYQPNIQYTGIIYSSVKQIETYIGENVSFHTYMTAINNPRSRIYTERINEFPYHGLNCRSYYGTVCSGLVSYALGLKPRHNSFDFPESDLFDDIEDYSPDNLQIGDVLWKKGHVVLVSDILRSDNSVSAVEISESNLNGTKRYIITSNHFNGLMQSTFSHIYRYKFIDRNKEYVSVPEFVAVGDEINTLFLYNNDICVDKGDKSCYLEDETVVVNILTDRASLFELYKDDVLIHASNLTGRQDIILDTLNYGDYKARVKLEGDFASAFSDYVYWKVINATVKFDSLSSKILISSKNSIPDYIVCCNMYGDRPHLSNGYFQILTQKDINRGFVIIPEEKMMEQFPYIKVFFKSEYGSITNIPINLFDNQ